MTKQLQVPSLVVTVIIPSLWHTQLAISNSETTAHTIVKYGRNPFIWYRALATVYSVIMLFLILYGYTFFISFFTLIGHHYIIVVISHHIFPLHIYDNLIELNTLSLEDWNISHCMRSSRFYGARIVSHCQIQRISWKLNAGFHFGGLNDQSNMVYGIHLLPMGIHLQPISHSTVIKS